MRGLIIASFLLLAGCATTRAPAPAPDVVAGVAFSREGEIASFADGVADPTTGRAVTADDPVRIASISKLVVAIGVMKLVEQGRLDLDADVSAYLGWSLRNPAFTDRAITLRQLLSHTSSIRDHDDQYAVPLGETVRGAMAQRTSWDTAHGPGEGYFRYSNMNFPIVASVVEVVTQERFDGVMRRDVLEPMKIDACFNWPWCSDAALARAVVLMQDGRPIRDDLKGKRPDCPVFVLEGRPCDIPGTWRPGVNGALFAPQGGLRISARGLARIGRMLLNGGSLDGVRLLSPQSVETLLRQVWHFNGRNGVTDRGFYCSYGLATHQIPAYSPEIVVDRTDWTKLCRDDPGTGGAVLVGHAGDAYGLRSGLWIDRARGTGIAYFVTGLSEDPPAGRSAFRSAEEAVFRRSMSLLPR